MTLSQQPLVIDANVVVSSVLSVQGKSRQAFDLAISTGIVLSIESTVTGLDC